MFLKLYELQASFNLKYIYWSLQTQQTPLTSTAIYLAYHSKASLVQTWQKQNKTHQNSLGLSFHSSNKHRL